MEHIPKLVSIADPVFKGCLADVLKMNSHSAMVDLLTHMGPQGLVAFIQVFGGAKLDVPTLSEINRLVEDAWVLWAFPMAANGMMSEGDIARELGVSHKEARAKYRALRELYDARSVLHQCPKKEQTSPQSLNLACE